MPRRDYMARSKKKSGANKSTILSIVVVLLLAMGAGLWLLKENAPAPTIPVSAEATKPVPNGTNLPSRPEEVYSYIRDLETREVVTNPNKKAQDKSTQLSPEQLKQLEEKRKQEELTRLAVEQASIGKVPVQAETVESTEKVAAPETALVAQKAQEQKLAEEKRKTEEKRKQAELKKQQELAQKKATTTENEQLKAEQAKLEGLKKEQVKTKVAETKQAEKSTSTGRFGLQCGAFKNLAQAENVQARLAMAGFNARIAKSADWNRVFVGPVGDRVTTSNAQSNARSVAECVIIAM